MSRLILLLFIISAYWFKSYPQSEPDFRIGNLNNGLKYYIHNTNSGDKKVNLYLVVKTGSLNEEDNQRGLAHFLEHMAFNGTKRFPGRSLINYLQSKGINFGYDLNAVTSLDKTVFRIENISVEKNLIDSSLLILKDWSGDILLDPHEIDAERKVITEEWRTTVGPQNRIREEIVKQLLPEGHLFITRPVIGDMEIVNSFSPSDLIAFYKKWYRPELQAIIVEGDIDPEIFIQKINELWNKDNHASKDKVPNPVFPNVPDSNTPLVAISQNAEKNNLSIDIQYWFQPENYDEISIIDITKKNLRRDLIASMLSSRLKEKKEESNSPVVFATAYMDKYIVSSRFPAFTIGASSSENNYKELINTLIYEINRIYKDGFTNEELKKAIHEKRISLQKRSKYSDLYMKQYSKYIQNFIYGEAIISFDEEQSILNNYLTTLKLDEINNEIRDLVNPSGRNTSIILRFSKDIKETPSQNSIIETYKKAWDQPTDKYYPSEYFNRAESLMDEKPKKGKIINKASFPLFNATQYTLSNGANVYFLPSIEDRDNIKISAVSKGGSSLFDIKDYPNYSVINSVVPIGGFYKYSPKDLQEILSDKDLEYNITVGPLTEQFQGSSSFKDFETLLQILYLRFTTVRKDSALFERWRSNYGTNVKSMSESPFTIISDSISALMYGKDNPLIYKITTDIVNRIDYDRVCELYLQRFKNASDFDFIVIGNIKENELEPLITQYIGSLNSVKDSSENYNENAIPSHFPSKNSLRFKIKTGNLKTTVTVTIRKKIENTLRNRLLLNILSDILTDYYIKEIRESLGGTYRINVDGNISKVPRDQMTLNISFETNPQQAEKLLMEVVEGIENISQIGCDNNFFKGIIQRYKNQYDSYYDSDEYKMNVIKDYLLYNSLESFDYIPTLESISESDIKQFASLIANSEDMMSIIIDEE